MAYFQNYEISKIFFSFIYRIFSIMQRCRTKKLIQGKWICTDWKVRGESKSKDQINVEFNFQDGGDYDYKNASLHGKGVYKVQGGKLYTTPENELEIAVNIEKLTTDTLIFNMSRGGTPESMLLVRN